MEEFVSYSLQRHNTFGVPSIANKCIKVFSLEDVLQLQTIPWKKIILGGGSNVLLQDRLETVVLNCLINEPRIIQGEGNLVYVQVTSGVNRDEFVKWTLVHNLYGLENLALIPGTVGGGALWNIGAYGKEIREHIYSIEYVDLLTNELVSLSLSECAFSYRDSVFKHMDNFFITSVTFVFDTSDSYSVSIEYGDIQSYIAANTILPEKLTPQMLYDIVVAIRTAKMPSRDEFGTAWSFFKNPIIDSEVLEHVLKIDPAVKYFPYGEKYKLAAGYLLERLGYKWKMILQESWGEVGCYRNQALIVVNKNWTWSEIDAFASIVEKDVFEHYGVLLERECITVQ